MKKFIAAVAVLSLVATPAFADGHRGDRGQHQHHERHERGGVSTSGAVAIGLGALILGGIISSRSNEERYRNPPQVIVVPPPPPPPPPQYVCQDVIKYDYYGNPYVTGRNCWYQY